MTHFIDDEIAAQPASWREAVSRAEPLVADLTARGERVGFTGCGTSWFMARVLAHWRESAGFGESDAFSASEVPDRRYDRIVAITRSGTTTEVLDLLDRFRGRTATRVVLGEPDSPAAELADGVVDLSFAHERSVVHTRFATSNLALHRAAFGHDVESLAVQAEAALLEPVRRDVVEAEQITFLGRGWGIPIADEAALKMRETSASWAESYPAMDYRHGPISIAAPGRVVWVFGDCPSGLRAEVEATGALFVGDGGDPVVELVRAQRTAAARARFLGVNPDEPRNVTRSVILT